MGALVLLEASLFLAHQALSSRTLVHPGFTPFTEALMSHATLVFIISARQTGSVSEQAAKNLYQLSEHALIDMGDFVGGTLKYLRRHPIARVTIAGGFGKLAKLAQGHLDLHSQRSRLDLTRLAAEAAKTGASEQLCQSITEATTGQHALDLASAAKIDLASAIARKAHETARACIGGGMCVDVLIVDRNGHIRGQAHDAT